MRAEWIDLATAADMLADETGKPSGPTLHWIVNRHGLPVHKVRSRGRQGFKLLIPKADVERLQREGWRARRPRRKAAAPAAEGRST